jgi:uncharacterized tellurite resistance protein B-like protein
MVDQEVARRVCRLIAGIVISDDDLDEKEEAFIDRLIERFDLTAEDRDALFPIVDKEEAATEIKTFEEAVRDETFGLLVEAAVADGKVVDEEKDYLAAVAEALGVSEGDLAERIAKALGGD